MHSLFGSGNYFESWEEKSDINKAFKVKVWSYSKCREFIFYQYINIISNLARFLYICILRYVSIIFGYNGE